VWLCEDWEHKPCRDGLLGFFLLPFIGCKVLWVGVSREVLCHRFGGIRKRSSGGEMGNEGKGRAGYTSGSLGSDRGWGENIGELFGSPPYSFGVRGEARGNERPASGRVPETAARTRLEDGTHTRGGGGPTRCLGKWFPCNTWKRKGKEPKKQGGRCPFRTRRLGTYSEGGICRSRGKRQGEKRKGERETRRTKEAGGKTGSRRRVRGAHGGGVRQRKEVGVGKRRLTKRLIGHYFRFL